jgi:hypothetical protein
MEYFNIIGTFSGNGISERNSFLFKIRIVYLGQPLYTVGYCIVDKHVEAPGLVLDAGLDPDGSSILSFPSELRPLTASACIISNSRKKL